MSLENKPHTEYPSYRHSRFGRKVAGALDLPVPPTSPIADWDGEANIVKADDFSKMGEVPKNSPLPISYRVRAAIETVKDFLTKPRSEEFHQRGEGIIATTALSAAAIMMFAMGDGQTTDEYVEDVVEPTPYQATIEEINAAEEEDQEEPTLEDMDGEEVAASDHTQE